MADRSVRWGDAIRAVCPRGPGPIRCVRILVNKCQRHRQFTAARHRCCSGDDPVNWVAAPPSAGRLNAVQAADTDHDGLPDAWEMLSFGGISPPVPARMPTRTGSPTWPNTWRAQIAREPASVLGLRWLDSAEGTLRLGFHAVAAENTFLWGAETCARPVAAAPAESPRSRPRETFRWLCPTQLKAAFTGCRFPRPETERWILAIAAKKRQRLSWVTNFSPGQVDGMCSAPGAGCEVRRPLQLDIIVP